MCLSSFQVHKEKMPKKKAFPLWITGKYSLNSFIKGCDLVKDRKQFKKTYTKEKPKHHRKYTQKEHTKIKGQTL